MDKKDTASLTRVELDLKARKKRFWDAATLKTPDRVPLACMDDYFCLSLGGATAATAYYEPEKAVKIYLEQIGQFNWDMMTPFGNLPGKVGEILGCTSNKWAGYNLPDNHEFQYVEKEYMSADEYDEFLKNPGDFTVRKLWPRMATGLEAFGLFPNLLVLSHSFAPISDLALTLGQPEVQEMLEKMLEAGKEMNKYNQIFELMEQGLNAQGFPMLGGIATAHAPFDWVSDYLRGIKGSMMDMYYEPDKLKAVIEVITPPMIQHAIETAKMFDDPVVFMPLHRGADPFMSRDQYAEFYWPGLKETIMAFVDAGLTPFTFWEGSYTGRLEFLQELPPGKVLSHFDVIDHEKAREMIGDITCFWGNVPAGTLMSGTPSDISDYVKKLIDIFADTGGLIIDGGAGIPKEAKIENVMALTETVLEYGVY